MTHATRIPGRRCNCARAGGFSLIELLFVIFILAVTIIMAAPNFAKFTKTSRVMETARTVSAALFQARSEAQRYRTTVAVFIGDDPAHMSVTPPPGILPPFGQMEIWAVRSQKDNGSWKYFGNWCANYDDQITSADAAQPYYPPDPTITPPVWYPFATKDMLLTPQPIQLPDNVRVISGRVSITPPATVDFTITDYQKSPLGVIKLHQAVFNPTGCPTTSGSTGGIGGYNGILAMLVFDTTTGECALIKTGHWYAAMRPEIMPQQLTSVQGVPITDFKKLNFMIDNIPPDN